MKRKGYTFYLIVAAILIGGGVFTYYNPDTLPEKSSSDTTDALCDTFKEAVQAYDGNLERELGDANVTGASCDCVRNLTNRSDRYIITSTVDTTDGPRAAVGSLGITFQTFPLMSQGPIIYPLTNATNRTRQTFESLQNQTRETSCTL